MVVLKFLSALFSKRAIVLIVDDDINFLETTATVLRAEGYSVIEAASGQEGIRKATSANPSLILLDIELPDINGWQVLQTLKAASKTKDIPVLILSSLNQVADVSQGLGLGAIDYLTKPLDITRLYAKVRQVLGHAA